MPAGRPTKYDPDMIATLDAMGADGEGMAEARVALGISADTFARWRDKKPEFSEAVKRFQDRSQVWWEKNGRLGTFGGTDGFNATSYIFNMKNRFRDEWADITRSEHTGKDGGPIQTEEVSPRDKLAAFLDAKSG